MKKTVKLEITDTGTATANLILFMNAWLEYAAEKANLSPVGIARVIDVFRDSSKRGDE